MRESAYQTAILNYLLLLENQGKAYVIRNNSFGGFIQRRDGSVGRINNVKRGTPDLLLCYQGRFIGLEVKSPTGRQSPDQKIAQKAIEKAGGIYLLVRGVDEVIAALEKLVHLWGSQSLGESISVHSDETESSSVKL